MLEPANTITVYRECLKDTLSLLAYDRPEESPHGALMSEDARGELADALDEYLLRQQGREQQSGLEHLLRTLVRASHIVEAVRFTQ